MFSLPKRKCIFNDGYFDGQTDDIRDYLYALSEEQVREVMNQGTVFGSVGEEGKVYKYRIL